jgi:predicted nucleic acid-binding protein
MAKGHFGCRSGERTETRSVMYVVDASVWVSRFLTFDQNHAASSQWLTKVARQRSWLTAPMILLAEVAGALSRRTGDSALARRCVRRLETLPHTRFFDVGLGSGRRASVIASDLRLRGSDAIYVSLGVDLGMQLVTWDEQQRQRAGSLISAASPLELLAQASP